MRNVVGHGSWVVGRGETGPKTSSLLEGVPAASIQRMLQGGARDLEKAKVPRARWNSEQLLARRLGCTPIALYVDPVSMDRKQQISFENDVACRAAGMPLQYLLGSAEFYGREFQVGPGVFIPRPETEVLLETALDLLRNGLTGQRANGPTTVVDVGTGCGAIAISLKLEHPGISVWGIDRSRTALSFANRNARFHEARVGFLEGDLTRAFLPACADLIVANLPYLDPEVSCRWPVELHWEPWLALDGGKIGLAFIKQLMAQVSTVLKPGGTLLLEIGLDQVTLLEQVAQKLGVKEFTLIRDLAGKERVVVLKWKS